MVITNARCLLKSITLVTSLLITGCSSFQSPTLIKVEKPTLTIPRPEPITTVQVRWIVITEENLAKVINDQKKNGDFALIALTPSGYKNLSSNQADILRYVQQQQAIIDAYQEYYKNPQPINNK